MRLVLSAVVLAVAFAAQATSTLHESVRTEALPTIISGDSRDLGAEALKIRSWLDRAVPPVRLAARGRTLTDARGASVAISEGMAPKLLRLNQWYGLATEDATAITHAQLKKAALSPESVSRIRALFERAIRRGAWVAGRWIVPESGGEAVLDGALDLAETEDTRWSTAVELLSLADSPADLSDHERKRPETVGSVDAHGLLRNALGRFRLGLPGSREEIRRAVTTLVQNAAPTLLLTPEKQLELVLSRDWKGRYVGMWHTHSPHAGPDRWTAGDVPSFEDMQNAVAYGQFLTLSFDPEGFDLHDASRLGDARRVDLNLVDTIRYRSREWREHFRRLLPSDPSNPPGNR